MFPHNTDSLSPLYILLFYQVISSAFYRVAHFKIDDYVSQSLVRLINEIIGLMNYRETLPLILTCLVGRLNVEQPINIFKDHMCIRGLVLNSNDMQSYQRHLA